MTPDDFNCWLTDMKAAGRARSDAECARLLDITPTWIGKLKAKGTDRKMALACRALLEGLEPYGSV